MEANQQRAINLTYRPKGDQRPFITTNLGEFTPGLSRLITKESDIAEALRLIENGDFVDAYDEPAESEPEPKTRNHRKTKDD